MYVCFGPRRVEHSYEFSLVFPQIRVCYIQDSWRSPDVQYHQYFEKSYRLLFVFAESSVGWSFRISEQSRTATFDCLAQPLEETLYMAWFAPLPFSTVLNDISLHKWTLRSAPTSSTTNTSYSVDCSPSEWIYGFLFETRLPDLREIFAVFGFLGEIPEKNRRNSGEFRQNSDFPRNSEEILGIFCKENGGKNRNFAEKSDVNTEFLWFSCGFWRIWINCGNLEKY